MRRSGAFPCIVASIAKDWIGIDGLHLGWPFWPIFRIEELAEVETYEAPSDGGAFADPQLPSGEVHGYAVGGDEPVDGIAVSEGQLPTACRVLIS